MAPFLAVVFVFWCIGAVALGFCDADGYGCSDLSIMTLAIRCNPLYWVARIVATPFKSDWF